MPYKRKGFGRARKVAGKKDYTSNGMSVTKMASLAYSGYKMLKHVLNPELKFWDASVSNLSIPTFGVTVPLSLMSQGSDYNNRNGNSIKLNNLLYRGQIIATATTTAAVRLIIYRDMESKQNLPATTDVLEVASIYSPLNHLNGTRFKIQTDQLFLFDNAHQNHTQHYSREWKNAHCKYALPSNGVNAAEEGNIYILLIGDNGISLPITSFYNRVRFYDN